jgi:hypothetical protein
MFVRSRPSRTHWTIALSWARFDTSANPAAEAERDEGLQLSTRLLLEKLSPTERAAYLLREAFNHPYRKIAEILRMKEGNVRQIVTRARDHVSGQPRASASSAEQRRFVNVMLAACRTGDLTRLERLLVADIVSKSERSGRSVALARARSTRHAPAAVLPHASPLLGVRGPARGRRSRCDRVRSYIHGSMPDGVPRVVA